MNTKFHIAALEAATIHIIPAVVAEFVNPVMLYSMVKDLAGVNPLTHGSKVHTDVMKTEGLKQAA